MEGETDSVKKRTRSDVSSTGSETDSKVGKPSAKNPKKSKDENTKEPIKKDAAKIESIEQLTEIKSNIIQINKKLENVMTKDDGSMRQMIKEMIQQMKTELLKSVQHRIDLLEAKLFERESDSDALKAEIQSQNKKIKEQAEECENLKQEVRANERKFEEYKNSAEQYSRANNIRISGIVEIPPNPNKSTTSMKAQVERAGSKEEQEEEESGDNVTVLEKSDSDQVEKNTTSKEFYETPEQTTTRVIETLNKQLPGLNITKQDIDMCHRLGKKGKKPRQIIVKFTSRLVKERLMQRKKQLKKPISVSDDLTALNYNVLMCVKKKQPDDIDYGWARNGQIFYKNKTGNVHRVQFREYETWLDLPWPEVETLEK